MLALRRGVRLRPQPAGPSLLVRRRAGVAGYRPHSRLPLSGLLGYILRFGQYALDMSDLPPPLDPQPLPFETT
jgi:hypothetical protein